MDWLLEKVLLYPKRSIAIGLVVLVVAGTLAWWFLIWQDPQRMFEDMLTRNLSTVSVTKRVTAGKNDASVDQVIHMQLSGAGMADWLVTAQQSGSSVATESIATPTTGYVRYVRISSTQKNAQGHPFDFSKVLNVWGKSDGQTDTSLNTLFDQTLLDITSAPTPPIANLSDEQRQTLLDYIQQEKVFAPDYTKVQHVSLRGHPAYVYAVAVKLGVYVRLMQAFAHDLKLATLDQVDPSQYDPLQPITVMMWVDPRSHQLLQLSYAGSGFTETYTDWGLLTPISLPKQTITTTDLQQRLQSLGS